MDAKTKKEKQTAQFKINVNNIVVLLLKNNTLFNQKSATRESVCLIMNTLGLKQRQAKIYLKEAREEILKVSEILKENAIKQAIESGKI